MIIIKRDLVIKNQKIIFNMVSLLWEGNRKLFFLIFLFFGLISFNYRYFDNFFCIYRLLFYGDHKSLFQILAHQLRLVLLKAQFSLIFVKSFLIWALKLSSGDVSWISSHQSVVDIWYILLWRETPNLNALPLTSPSRPP